MIRKGFFLSALIAGLFCALAPISHAASEGGILPKRPELELAVKDRILIFAAHPDDEILGCGGVIQKAIEMQIPLRVVFLTYGDFNEWSFLIYQKHPVIMPGAVRQMGLIRYDEALYAAEILGLSQEQIVFLGYPDYGTLQIWYAHWGDRPPFQSGLTRVKKVPYPSALRFGAPYKGEELLQDIETVIRDFRPTKIFVNHPADHHPDHRSFYLFTRVALWDMAREIHAVLYPYLIHYKQWPKPLGQQAVHGRLEPPASLQQQIPWKTFSLRPDQVDRKRKAIRAHRTQYNSSAGYLLSFIRPNELFGDFPDVFLRSDDSSQVFPSPTQTEYEAPEQLTDEERASFVGVEWRYAQLKGDEIILSVDLSRPLAQEVGVSFYVFGYRSDRPFEKMPKLHVQLGLFGWTVSNQNQRLPFRIVRVTRQPKQVILYVPLEILAYPEKVLTSARTYFGDLPLDWVSWRVLDLSEKSS